MNLEAQGRVIAFAKARGNCPKDFRDAVHELAHVIDTGLQDSEDWGRETIHAAISRLAPDDRFQLECRARAAEAVACEKAGIAYDPRSWATVSCLEALKNGVSASPMAWTNTIYMMTLMGEGAKLWRKVRALSGVS